MHNIKEKIKMYNFIIFLFLSLISYASESQNQSIDGDCNVQIQGDKSNIKMNCIPSKENKKGQIDTESRRDFIAACMFNGGFAVKGKEPTNFQKDGVIDIERTVNSWVNSFEDPAYKLKAGEEIRKCLKEVLSASTYQPTPSRIVPRDNLYADLALRIDPVEYAKGIICKRPDIRNDIKIGYELRRLSGKNLDQNFKDSVDNTLFNLFGLNQSGSIEKAIMNLDPNEIDCGIDRICEVRGSVPVEVNTDTMYVFGIPMRQVKVLAGQCKDKTGFVNERFIDF